MPQTYDILTATQMEYDCIRAMHPDAVIPMPFEPVTLIHGRNAVYASDGTTCGLLYLDTDTFVPDAHSFLGRDDT